VPDYFLRCQRDTCGHKFEAFHSMKADHPPCPECGSPTESDLSRLQGVKLLNPNRTFTNTMSYQFGFHPDEVDEVAAMLGADVAHCIVRDGPDRGDVHFKDREEERRFRERYVAVRAANEERERERRAREREDPRAQERKQEQREQLIAAGADPDELDEEDQDDQESSS
jgi:hypothetical protein